MLFKNKPINYIFRCFSKTIIWVLVLFLFISFFPDVYSKEVKASAQSLKLEINNQEYFIDSDIYDLFHMGRKIELGSLPVFPYDGVLMVRANRLAEEVGATYKQTDENAVIKLGDISINFTFNSKIAYVNGRKIMIDAPLLRAKCLDSQGASYAIVPLEFTLDALGIAYNYDIYSLTIATYRTSYTGDLRSNSYISSLSYDSTQVESTPDEIENNLLFSWNTLPQNEAYTEGNSHKYLQQVSAYRMPNSEAIVLTGIASEHVECFIDGSYLIIMLSDIGNLCGDCFYDSEDNKYINRCLLSGNLEGNTKIKVLLNYGDTFYKTYNEHQTAIHIKNESVVINDTEAKLIETKKESSTPSNNIQQKLPDDKLLLTLPTGTRLTDIKDYDNYLNYNFQISIKGDCVALLKNKGIVNPYSLIEGYSVNYNSKTGYTTISFDTKLICAYKYEIIQDHLVVTVGRPNEIYSKIVLLDAGHGGSDPGAIYNKTNEKDLNFKILNTYCKEYFAESDIKAYFTRETDVLISLKDRAAFASEVCADFFISLHMNSNTSTSVNGTQVFYYTGNNTALKNGLKSSIIAQQLVNDLSAALGTRNRGIDSQNFYVTRYNKVPAVLIELGFMTNSNDYAKITNVDYQKKAAKTILESVKTLYSKYYK